MTVSFLKITATTEMNKSFCVYSVYGRKREFDLMIFHELTPCDYVVLIRIRTVLSSQLNLGSTPWNYTYLELKSNIGHTSSIEQVLTIQR